MSPHAKCSQWDSTDHMILRHTDFCDLDPDYFSPYYVEDPVTAEIACPYADIKLIMDDGLGGRQRFLLLVKSAGYDSQETSQLAAVKMRLEAVRGALERCMSHSHDTWYMDIYIMCNF